MGNLYSVCMSKCKGIYIPVKSILCFTEFLVSCQVLYHYRYILGKNIFEDLYYLRQILRLTFASNIKRS